MDTNEARLLLSRLFGTLRVSRTHLEEGSADWALAVVDAVNAATKDGQKRLYEWKVDAINAALKLGCSGGWVTDFPGELRLFALYTPSAGVACFHIQPSDEAKLPAGMRWPYQWSGIKRQPFAIHALEDPKLFHLLARHTQPDNGKPSDFRSAIVGTDWERLLAVRG